VTSAAISAVAIAGCLMAYAIGGTLAAFVAASALFTAAAIWIRRGVPAAPTPIPLRRVASEHTVRQDFPGLVRTEVELLSAMGNRRIYDHGLKPRLYRLAVTLLAQRSLTSTPDAHAVRNLVGDELWPLMDPAVKSFDVTPRVPPAEMKLLLTKLEQQL
jgi:hypothetical protein